MTEPEPVKMTQLAVNINSTGRQVMIALPADVTDAEILEFSSWMGAPDGLREAIRPRSKIEVVRGIARPS